MSRTHEMNGLVEHLLAQRTARKDAFATLRTSTAAFCTDLQSTRTAMAQTQAETLVDTRRQMSAQIADFRRTVQTTNQANAKALHENLVAERAHLLAETTQFIGKIQTDAAGVAAAWHLLSG